LEAATINGPSLELESQARLDAAHTGESVFMTAPYLSRSFSALTAIAGCAATLTLGLAGCQSEQEQRIAEAKELLRQKQMLQAASGQTAPAAAPAQPVAPANSAGADDLAMPLYPNAKEVKMGPGRSAGLGDGLVLSLLETQDSVDAVIAFYSEKLKTPESQLQPTRTEDRIDGRRVVRLSVPREDGGLLTVEARDEPGKTTIQLMNMKGKPGGAVPPRIPGVPEPAPSRDLTAPPDTGTIRR
jgi:hypothetical protein